MRKHTRGPWEWEDGALWGKRERCILGCITEAWAPNNDADAALIAAAPELLEALREAVQRIDGISEYGSDDARVAKWKVLIAKAEGYELAADQEGKR